MTVRRHVAAVIGASAAIAAVPPAASADGEKPSPKLKKTYLKAYDRAERAGHEPGRNIVRLGVREDGERRPARRSEIRKSLRILRRMVAPPAAPAAPAGTPATGRAPSGRLAAIASCESGGNPAAVSADGRYRGKYQFDMQTWQSVGGTGDPAAAPEAEQDRRAQALMAQRGASPWPTCG